MVFKVVIDHETCIGCGACVATCEASFEMDGDKAKVKTPTVEDGTGVKEAAEGCPVDCIHVTEE